MITQLNSDQIALQKQYEQLSTGRRVQNFTDDPVAAAHALSFKRGIDRGNQLVRNANSTASFYAATDNALARVDSSLIEARGAAVEAAQSVIDDDQREAIATTVRESIRSVFAAANSLFRERQILSGILNGGDAFSFDGNEIVYNGTNAVGRAALGPGGTDLVITRTDGVVLEVNLDDAESVDDVIDLIENHPLNVGSKQVLVDLNDVGHGIQLKAPPDADPLSVRQVGASNAGIRLGLVPPGSNENTGQLIGAVNTIVGADYAVRDAGGALDTRLRLEDAIRTGDINEIERLQSKLDIDLDTASRSRGKVGVWSRNLEQLNTATEDCVIQMRDQLSNEIDTDFAKVISDDTASIGDRSLHAVDWSDRSNDSFELLVGILSILAAFSSITIGSTRSNTDCTIGPLQKH